jgi:NAD+ synthase (glutamine-hydrolysing)
MVAEMYRRAVLELGFKKFQHKIGLPYDEKDFMSQLLVTAYQRTENSSDETFQSAESLAQSIGATFYYWNIDDQVAGARSVIEKALGRSLTWEKDDVAMQNIQARARSPIIWMLANIKNALLLATSNRSEGAVGYTTMDGDTSGSISPIAGVDKPFLRQWLRYAEKRLHYTGLEYVNALQPTAELRPLSESQTDEDDLMRYDILQQIERAFVYEKKARGTILHELSEVHGPELSKEWLDRFFALWKRNQWKRERLAPSFHLDDYNLDPRSWFRYPILSGS